MSSVLENPTVPELCDKTIQNLSQVFHMLADETRLRIMTLLAGSGGMNVTELCQNLGQSQPAVSHHLKLLRLAGLIELRRLGRHNYYLFRREGLRRLMNTLMHERSEIKPCNCFLDCVLGF